MKKIGLTGSIGAGKSAAAAFLRARGVPVHDADAAVHEIYTRPDVIDWMKQHFPAAVQGRGLDRAQLAETIYASNLPGMRQLLESYIHPLVKEHSEAFSNTAARRGAAMAVFDIPLLFETGRDADMDETWLITAPREVRRARALGRLHMTADKFERIDAAQMPETEKNARATQIIENNGTMEELHEKLLRLF